MTHAAAHEGSSNPTLVLRHGFPSSSVMFRDLMPRLADRFHLIAPDYLGFGRSDAPSPSAFSYTFDRLSEVVDRRSRAPDRRIDPELRRRQEADEPPRALTEVSGPRRRAGA